MAEFAKLPLWTDSLLGDTGHLTNEEFGIYMRLLIMIWRNSGCRIPANPEWIKRRVSASESEYEEKYKPIISEYLKSDGNYLTQKRLMKEFLYLREISEKSSASAKMRWNKNKAKSDGNAPKPNEPNSDTKVSAPIDFKKIIFDEGLRWLSDATGRNPTSMRTLLGKWCKLYGDAPVAGALVDAQKFSPVEPISYLEKSLKEKLHEKPRGAAAQNARPNKTDRLYAAAREAVGHPANGGSEGEGEAGSNDSPKLPGI